jgi:hypothetical protein
MVVPIPKAVSLPPEGPLYVITNSTVRCIPQRDLEALMLALGRTPAQQGELKTQELVAVVAAGLITTGARPACARTP